MNSSISPNRASAEQTRMSKWPWVFAILVGVMGTAFSVVGWHVLRRIERNAIEEEFRAQAAALAQRVEREVAMTVEVLESLSLLHTLSDRISREDFSEFVVKGMRFHQEVLGAFGFVQQMDEEMRVLVETSETNALRIVCRDPEDPTRFTGVPAKGVYFPLTYQYPEGGLECPLGFDFSSDHVYAAAIARLLNTGRSVLAGEAPAEGQGEKFFLFAPIMYVWMSEGEGRPVGRSLVGFTVGLFSPREIIVRALGGDKAALERTGWKVEWGFSREPQSPAKDREGRAMLTYDTDVQVADVAWRIRFGVAWENVSPLRRRPSTLALIVGLMLTGLLTTELLMLAGRGRRVEKLVRTRTAELIEAKNQLEREMRRRVDLEQELISAGMREKLRVGQDLHDSLGQKLTGALLLSGALSRRVAQVAPENAADANALHELLKDSVAQVRRMARGLAPVELGERGLVGALEQLIEDVREAAPDIECELDCPAAWPTLEAGVAMHLYHIAQEAVTNALRHAEAREIRITLSISAGSGEMAVADDGRGFDPSRHAGKGMGLEILRYRADLIGAKLTVESSAGRGTKITCKFPVKAGSVITH